MTYWRPLTKRAGSVSQLCGYGSAKPWFLIPTVLWFLFDFLSLKNDLNVPSTINKQQKIEKISFCWDVRKKLVFVGILKVNDENSRIRIHCSEAWIRRSGSVPNFHDSATLLRIMELENYVSMYTGSESDSSEKGEKRRESQGSSSSKAKGKEGPHHRKVRSTKSQSWGSGMNNTKYVQIPSWN